MNRRALPGRRAFMVGGTLALAGIAGYAATPRATDPSLAGVDLEKTVPNRLGDWAFRGREGMVVAREDAPIEGYNQLLTRVYSAPGKPEVMLLIAYGATQGGGLQLHRPETCYPGEGFRIFDLHPEDLDVGIGRPVEAKSFTARRDERVEQVLYWTRIGHHFPRSTTQEYAAIVEQVLRGMIPDGTLVRMSIIGGDVAQSLSTLRDFARTFIQDVPEAHRAVLIG